MKVVILMSLLLLGKLDASAFLRPQLPLHRLPCISARMVVIQESSAHFTKQRESDVSTSKIDEPIDVDMNMYNLENIDAICEEWSASVVAGTSMMAEGIYLQPRNKNEIMADTLKIAFPRLPDMGLGLQLLELAGGRDDGIGITIVSEVVKGGASDGSGVLPGDSIVKIDLQRKNYMSDTNGFQESEDMFSVETECLGYDKTVDAILTLPLAEEACSDMFVITVKRLRRRPKVRLNLQYPQNSKQENISLELFAGENLRRAMLVRGVKLNDKLASRFDSGGSGDCGAEGTCATCAVSVIEGQNLLSPAGQQESQIFTNHPRWRMACKAIVGYGLKEGTITVRVEPRQWNK